MHDQHGKLNHKSSRIKIIGNNIKRGIECIYIIDYRYQICPKIGSINFSTAPT